MARRQVTRTRKDPDGDITALCNTGASWSPRSKQSAISDIESDSHTYYVREDGDEVDVVVIDDPDGKYLRTDPDQTPGNNLDNLPNC